MSRSSSVQRWTALGVLIALVATLSWTVLTPSSAGAQASTDATLALTVSPASAEQSFRTVAVSIDPGDGVVAALGATLTYNAEQILVTSCDVAEAGACNADNGQVLVSVFNLSGIKANDQLLTVNFEPLVENASTEFTLTVDTAVNLAGEPLPEIVVTPIDAELTELQFGSLTGDVVAADSQIGVYGIDICATNTATLAEQCTTTSGLGTWRLDGLVVGDYTVATTDASGVYAAGAAAGTVLADDVVAGLDIALTFAADEEPNDEDVAADEESSEDIVPVPVQQENTPQAVIVYEASIAGRVTAVANFSPLEAVTVCATQPLVLHQSCAATDANGDFALADLSTGNYWITVVDPLGRYADSTPKLVGVVGDAVRDGVQIQLAGIGA